MEPRRGVLDFVGRLRVSRREHIPGERLVGKKGGDSQGEEMDSVSTTSGAQEKVRGREG